MPDNETPIIRGCVRTAALVGRGPFLELREILLWRRAPHQKGCAPCAPIVKSNWRNNSFAS